MDLEETKKEVLKLIKIFDEVCTKYDIKYTMTAGSVLGAVRHKGFIPWDYDMDVVVPITQFDFLREKLLERIKSEDNLVLHMWDKEKKYYEVVDRLSLKNIPHQLLHVDIFPLIGAPSTLKKQKRFADLCFYSYRLLRCKNCDTKYSKPSHVRKIKILKFFTKIIPDKIIIRWYKKLQNKYPFDDSEYVYVLASGYGIDELVKKDVFLDTKRVKFEDTKLNIPKKSKYYLTRIYGEDYMVPKKEGYKKIDRMKVIK